MEYIIFNPKVDKPLHELSREEAVLAYDWFISNIPIRLEQLFRLLALDGIELNFTEDSLKRLHDWFFELVVEERRLGNSTPSSELFSVCNDIGIYLSEFVIRSANKVKWLLFVKDKSGLSYQRPVITGFDVKNRDYYIDFDYLVCQYAFRILNKGNKENQLFEAMIKKALTLIE